MSLNQDMSDSNSYLQHIQLHSQGSSAMAAKGQSGTSSTSIPSFSPAQSFATSTFSPSSVSSGVGGGITSLSDFINHPMQPTYTSSHYSQHNFVPSIPQSQYSYHHGSVAASLTTTTTPPPNLTNYSSSSNVPTQPHHSSGIQPTTHSMMAHPDFRKNQNVGSREESFNYPPVPSKHSSLKAHHFYDMTSGSNKSHDLSNARSSKQPSGGRGNSSDNKNYPNGIPSLQYGSSMFSVPSSQYSSAGASHVQQMNSENDPSTLFSVNQLVNHKTAVHHGTTAIQASSSGKKPSKRGQNTSGTKAHATNSNQGSSKGVKQPKFSSGNSDFVKDSITNKDATKNTSPQ